MEMEVDEPLYDFDAPQYIDFLNDAEHENPDKWFDERNGDDGGFNSFLMESPICSNPESARLANTIQPEISEPAKSIIMEIEHPELKQKVQRESPLKEIATKTPKKTTQSEIPKTDRILRSAKKTPKPNQETSNKTKNDSTQKNSSKKRSLLHNSTHEEESGSAKKKTKMEIKKSLMCIPRTPAMMRRMKAQPKKTTVENSEVEKLEELQKETNKQIKLNQNYMKKALGPIQLPSKPKASLTMTKEFKFATDDRIKAQKTHDMQTRSDATVAEKPFTSQLRRHSPSPIPGPTGPTKAKPFKCATADTHASKQRSNSEVAYKPLAAIAMDFQTKTPERFRHSRKRTNSCDTNKPATKLTITHPHTPNLLTKRRSRNVHIESHSDQVEKEIESMKSYQFKATEFDSKIVQKNGMYGVSPLKKIKSTEVKPFSFESDKRSGIKSLKDSSQDQTQCKNQTQRRSVPSIRSRITEPNNHSIYERDMIRKTLKERKIKEVIQAEEKLREFHARPLPAFETPKLPEVQSKLPTKLQPFKMQGELITVEKEKKFQDKLQKEQEEMKEKAEFKAQSSQVLYNAPFQPKPASKPLTAIQPFNLNTDTRSKKREEYDMQLQKAHEEKELQKQVIDKEKEMEENKQIKKFRRSIVHTARPVPTFKEFQIQKSNIPLTEAMTPNFATNKRIRGVSPQL